MLLAEFLTDFIFQKLFHHLNFRSWNFALNFFLQRFVINNWICNICVKVFYRIIFIFTILEIKFAVVIAVCRLNWALNNIVWVYLCNNDFNECHLLVKNCLNGHVYNRKLFILDCSYVVIQAIWISFCFRNMT